MDAVQLEPTPIGYGRQQIREADVQAVLAVLRSERLTQGPAVQAFEEELCRATGAPHAVALNSGTAGLQLALAALEIGPGSTVVTTATTFLASATAALWCGAEVEFVDIDPHTFNLDLDALERRLEDGNEGNAPRVDAVVPVHLAGLPCDMERLVELKQRFGFRIVEDACHALGGSYAFHGVRTRVGALSEVDASVFSFHPVKHVTTGEGGAVLTHDRSVAERVRRLRHHGMASDPNARPFSDSETCPPWHHPMTELAGNFRLSDLGAALGASQLTGLDGFLAERREQAARYDAAFERGLFPGLVPPPRSEGHAWHLYVVRCDGTAAGERDALIAYLAKRGIGTQLHYYPVPMQPYFRGRYGEPRVPCAEDYARRALSLPIYPGLGDDDQRRVIEALSAWCTRRGEL